MVRFFARRSTAETITVDQASGSVETLEVALRGALLTGRAVRALVRPANQQRVQRLTQHLGAEGVHFAEPSERLPREGIWVHASTRPEDSALLPLALSGATRTICFDRPDHAAVRNGRNGFRVPRLPEAIAAAVSDEPQAVRSQSFRTTGLDLAAVLELGGAQGFVIPGEPPTVVVPTSSRRRVVDALAPDATEDPVSELAVPGSGFVVQFWPEVNGRLHAITANEYVDSVPAQGGPRTSIQIGSITAPTFTLMTRRSFADLLTVQTPQRAPESPGVPGPVDVVITWVDDQDPDWRARRDQTLARVDGHGPTASGASRFTNRDELRSCLRSLADNAPWVRTVHLVTDRQSPSWLGESDWIRVVDHTDLLPGDALPTFNSQAIETALHRIDGLAEQFLYFNDDVMLGQPVTPEDFFTADGRPRVFASAGVVGIEEPGAPLWRQAAWNNRRLVQERFDRTTTHTMLHTPHPMSRSLLQDVERSYPDALATTARAPFRSPTDVSTVSSLAQHHGLATGAAVAGSISHRYLGLDSPAIARRLRQTLEERDVATFCVGDAPFKPLGEQRTNKLLKEFLDAYFAQPGSWERDRGR